MVAPWWGAATISASAALAGAVIAQGANLLLSRQRSQHERSTTNRELGRKACGEFLSAADSWASDVVVRGGSQDAVPLFRALADIQLWSTEPISELGAELIDKLNALAQIADTEEDATEPSAEFSRVRFAFIDEVRREYLN